MLVLWMVEKAASVCLSAIKKRFVVHVGVYTRFQKVLVVRHGRSFKGTPQYSAWGMRHRMEVGPRQSRSCPFLSRGVPKCVGDRDHNQKKRP